MPITYSDLPKYPDVIRMDACNDFTSRTFVFDRKFLALVQSQSWTFNKTGKLKCKNNSVELISLLFNISLPKVLIVFKNEKIWDLRESNVQIYERNKYILAETESILEIRSNTKMIDSPIIVKFSTCDYEKIKQFCWRIDNVGYAMSSSIIDGVERRKTMHLFILDRERIDDGKITDHLDRNRLNNVRTNLRVTDYTTNNRNRTCTNEHGQNGVYKLKNSWVASWPDPERPKKRIQKYFSILKYGETEALRLAIAIRQEYEKTTVGFDGSVKK